jgi:nephrocystin-3
MTVPVSGPVGVLRNDRPWNHPREIRVFISSTFSDMHEERDELVKLVFPQLRRLCEKREVTWGEVDLRWGVTDEARVEGNVLPLCFKEIDRCRPFFIGILGERYGNVPTQIPEEFVIAQPWLRQHRNKSVTELEIRYGALRNPERAGLALFYFRDPTYAATRQGFSEKSAQPRNLLKELKEEIRRSGHRLFENFASSSQLGERVLHDMTTIIDYLYPENTRTNPLDRSALDHEAYAVKRRVPYIDRSNYLDRLNDHAVGSGAPYVLMGQDDVITALLARWTLQWRMQHPETSLIVHYVGATRDSTEGRAMLHRLVGELRRTFDLRVQVPHQIGDLRVAFANALHMAAAKGRLVLVIDALHNLDNRDATRDLGWLPAAIPENIRLVVSVRLGAHPNLVLTKLNWQFGIVTALLPDERTRIITDYLGSFGKRLNEKQTHVIATSTETGNAVVLVALLDELKQLGQHSELDAHIDAYIKNGIFCKALQRWERDFCLGGRNIVRESLVRLWAARRGLSEAELLDSLGRSGPVPRIAWSRFYWGAEGAIVNNDGMLTCAYEYRGAVQRVYLPSEQDRKNAHRALAEYFLEQPQGYRRLQELPWQLQESAEWRKLAELLSQPDFLIDLMSDEFDGKYDAAAYWLQIETGSPWRMEEFYEELFLEPIRNLDYASSVLALLQHAGRYEPALRLMTALERDHSNKLDDASLEVLLEARASALMMLGDLDNALAVHEQRGRICSRLGNKLGLQASLSDQAEIQRKKGNLDSALSLVKEALQICDELGASSELAGLVQVEADILCMRGDLEAASTLYEKAERLSRESGDRGELQAVLCNRGNLLMAQGQFSEALCLFAEQEQICRELGMQDSLAGALGSQACLLYHEGEIDRAAALFEQVERICRELGNKDRLRRTLGHRALVQADRGDLDGALALHSEEENLCHELGDPEGLSVFLANRATILRRIPDRMDQARECIDQAIAIATKHRFASRLASFERIRASIGTV